MINETKLELLLLNYILDNINDELGNVKYIKIENDTYDITLMNNRSQKLLKQFLEPYKITE